MRIYSLADGMIDYSDFHKSLALFLAEALLDKELKTRAKHSKEAKKREWAKGRFIASRIPFGYIRDTAGKLVHHPENAAIIKRFFERCAQGVPITTMVKEYNASKGKGPDGTSLHIESLRWMLRNPVYCGKLYVDGRLIKCIDIDEPIISEQLYHKAVKLYESRKRIVSNRAKSSGGLASGIIRCGLCGYAMIHWHSSYGPAYRKYMCGVRSSTGCKCAINANNLDGFINCFTPLKGIIEHRQIGIDAEEKKQLPELREREGLLNDKIDKYMDRIESEDVAVFADVFKRLKTELIKVQQRIVDLENIPDTPVKKEMVAVFDQEFEGLSIDEKRLALRSVIKTIVVFPDKVTFTLASEESFGVDRMAMGGRRIWLPPVHIRRMSTGEHLKIVIEQGIDETKTLLDGRLLLVKSSTLHLDEGVEENRSTHTRRKRAIAFMRAQLRK